MFSTLNLRRWMGAGFSKPLFFILFAGLSLTAMGLAGCGDDDGGSDQATPTGTVSGQVLTAADGDPIEGAVVTLTPIAGKAPTSTSTDATGSFEFTLVEAGDYDLDVDASAVEVDPANADLEYVQWSVRITVVAGEENIFESHLAVIDISEGVTVEDGEPTVVEPESIPGLRLEIPADAVTFPGGGSTGEIYVVELGFDQGPTPLAEGYAPSLMVQILPEGTTFDPPATLRLPNRDGLPAGAEEELFSFDSLSRAWVSEGMYDVDGDYATPQTGVTLGETSTHFLVCEPHDVVGMLLDDVEDPVVGATVQLYAYVNPLLQGVTGIQMEGVTATTGADGSFSFTGVRASLVGIAAEYVSAEAYGYLEPTMPVLRDASGTTDLGAWMLEMITESVFDVAGTVRYEDGSPAAGVSVGVDDPNVDLRKQVPPFATTDAQGHYLIEDIQWEPGAEVRVWAYDEARDLGGEEVFNAPSLAQSGSTVTVDLRLCSPYDSPCGEWGTWDLDGNEVTLQLYRYECGEVVHETVVVTIMSLQNGTMVVQVPEGQGSSTQFLERVQGFGPSGVNSTNLVGVYRSLDEPFILAFYADGTMNSVSSPDETTGLAGGTYAVEGEDLLVDFLFSEDPEGPPLGESSFPFTLIGDTLTIVNAEEGEQLFDRCPHGPDNGLEGLWWLEHESGNGFRLLLYGGEMAGVEYRITEY